MEGKAHPETVHMVDVLEKMHGVVGNNQDTGMHGVKMHGCSSGRYADQEGHQGKKMPGIFCDGHKMEQDAQSQQETEQRTKQLDLNGKPRTTRGNEDMGTWEKYKGKARECSNEDLPSRGRYWDDDRLDAHYSAQNKEKNDHHTED